MALSGQYDSEHMLQAIHGMQGFGNAITINSLI